jgi:ribosome biogenesis protein BRX1
MLLSSFHLSFQIWVRNYQIVEEKPDNALQLRLAKKSQPEVTIDDAATSVVEIGPRFVLNPIRIFRGSFGGQSLFQNPDFVSPNEIRSAQGKRKGDAYMDRKEAQKKRTMRESEMVLPADPLASVFR